MHKPTTLSCNFFVDSLFTGVATEDTAIPSAAPNGSLVQQVRVDAIADYQGLGRLAKLAISGLQQLYRYKWDAKEVPQRNKHTAVVVLPIISFSRSVYYNDPMASAKRSFEDRAAAS